MSEAILRKAKDTIFLSAQELCSACGGELLAGGEGALIGSIITDTRQELAGSLFVALKGERFDGSEFAEEALARGAAGVLADLETARRLAAVRTASGSGQLVIGVADTGAALKRIASLVAEKSGARLVAITGSSGKTSTKDILFGLLQEQLAVTANRASFNNDVGVPLTLLDAGYETDVIVVEMGMQAPGEIGELCRVASPEIAIITNIGPAHLEHAGSLANVARGKAEIAQGLKPGGKLVAPYGEELLRPHLAALEVEILTFGFDRAADVHPLEYHLEGGGYYCAISCCGQRIEAQFSFAARHHLANAMAAIAAYHLLGLPLEQIAAAARQINLTGLRGEALPLRLGGTLLNDCYNANPLSVGSALEYLASAGAGARTVAILGDMGELGSQAPLYHRQVGARAAELGIACLIGVGPQAADYLEGAQAAGFSGELHHFPEREQALAVVPGLIQPGDVVLVKASRFMRLEELSALLTGTGAKEGQL